MSNNTTSLTIAFHTPNLNFRGSCVALFDYAHYAETMLHHRSIIITDNAQQHTNDKIAFKWISNRFPVYTYNTKHELEELLRIHNCDILYCIKYGKNDGVFSKTVYTVIHCVFDMSEPHGTHYIAVSESIALKFGFPKKCSLPHMVSMPMASSKDTIRDQLHIPESAIVFGRHGGKDTFNVQFVKSAISKIVRSNSDIYFLFLNAPEWDTHPQIIYLPATTDVHYKQKFINSCNAMIVPEKMGHSFGLSIAEFYIHSKPIICYNDGDLWNTAHIDILKENAIYFDTETQFGNIIVNFEFHKNKLHISKNSSYFQYTPKKVMQLFNDRIISTYRNHAK